MADPERAVLTQIYEAVNLRYDMEIQRGCSPPEARQRALVTAEYVTRTLPEHERTLVLLQLAHSLERRGP
ncbi:hypothetical protein [Deinococcus gobiensis]|uniref:Uncharacterized protein n=1 Tax=Deinococcus gobiensis (strain DSM 21396 / JCM 16679 / CGMCC 1.7299 / I-0) TaxID=745776 RepID=H8H280_DEIGI|nr:hypothetical protein [Deinococcus gobiensis]AFD27627.1 hypothetical protein DGo_PB0358 [Deinococcus gobiensis I-0]